MLCKSCTDQTIWTDEEVGEDEDSYITLGGREQEDEEEEDVGIKSYISYIAYRRSEW